MSLKIILILIGISICNVAYADPLDREKVIHCILGEARGEGLEGMTAVAEAIRNRGTLSGVYGCNAAFNEPQYVWDLAAKAWELSKDSNLVAGADHWASLKIDKKWDSWAAARMTFTAKIGSHNFYRSNISKQNQRRK